MQHEFRDYRRNDPALGVEADTCAVNEAIANVLLATALLYLTIYGSVFFINECKTTLSLDWR